MVVVVVIQYPAQLQQPRGIRIPPNVKSDHRSSRFPQFDINPYALLANDLFGRSPMPPRRRSCP